MGTADFPHGDVWDMFKLILSVPHPSGGEHELVRVLAGEAEKRGLQVKTDDFGNLRIDRPASAGFEDEPVVIMQGHLDMVCEKTPESDFDFEHEGIRTMVSEDGFIHACGTTLGADNGIGSAMALAMLFDENYCGRAIAGVFTREEETGLSGASNLANDMVAGKYLINLDSDRENNFCVGCAGGARLSVSSAVPLVPAADGYCVEISVSGLPGGHSGCEIAAKHGNALIFLARILDRMQVDVVDIFCHNADNVIPSSAKACVISQESPETIANICCSMVEEYKKELASGIEVEVDVISSSRYANMWESGWRKKMISAMTHLPNGVLEFAPEFNVPRTSSNFASAKVVDGILELHFSQRSLDNAERANATQSVMDAFDGIDCKKVVSKEYSGWKPAKEAHINQVASAVWQKLYGITPELHVIHAGLEAGILSMKNPELELISFGPTAYDIHSVKERLEIASVDRVYKFLRELVREL